MKTILPYLKAYRGKLALTAVLCVISTLEGVFLPHLMSRIVDEGIAAGDMGVIWTFGAIMFGLALCSMLCALLTSAVNARISAGFSHDLTRGIFQKASGLNFETFSKIGTSGLLTRSTHDVMTISQASSMFVNFVTIVPILVIGGAVFAMLSDRVLGLILLCSTPLALLILFPIVKNLDKLWKLSDEYIDEQNRTIAQNNAIIARQNAQIAMNLNASQSSYDLANRLGLTQSYAYASSQYYYDDGVFYIINSNGQYSVIVPPAGALVDELPDDYDTLTISGMELYRVDDTVYRTVMMNGHPYLEVLGQMYGDMARRYVVY